MEGLHYHLFADDMQGQKHGRQADVSSIISALEDCATDVSTWCTAKHLQLNAEKTEVLWFGTPANLRIIPSDNHSIRLGSTVVDPLNVVRNLVSEMTYTVLSGTLNSSIPYRSQPWCLFRSRAVNGRPCRLCRPYSTDMFLSFA